MNIGFIPVRGGSKSIPLKNIKLFCGEPLIYWTLKALNESKYIDKIVIATDSDKIREVCQKYVSNKVQIYNRSDENAKDHSSTESVILEYINSTDFDTNDKFVLVQATSPFLQSVDIDGGFELLQNTKSDSLLSAVTFKRFLWTETGESINYDYRNRPRRQDFKGLLMENGAFYINYVGNILTNKNRISGKIAVYEMPEFSAVEIDEIDDWFLAEALFRKYILKVD